MKENPKVNLKLQYKKVLELGLIVSLILHIFLMQGYKKIKIRAVKRTAALEAIQLEEMPRTQQQKQAPAPSRPTVPIASEDETLPEDETIDFTDLNLETEAPPPLRLPPRGMMCRCLSRTMNRLSPSEGIRRFRPSWFTLRSHVRPELRER